MKHPIAVLVAVVCAVAGCGSLTAEPGKPHDIGFYLLPNDGCPPANYAVYSQCVAVLSRDPIVCGHPLVGYSVLSNSDIKKLEEIGSFVSANGAFTDQRLCGQMLFEFKEFKRGIPASCPVPAECF